MADGQGDLGTMLKKFMYVFLTALVVVAGLAAIPAAQAQQDCTTPAVSAPATHVWDGQPDTIRLISGGPASVRVVISYPITGQEVSSETRVLQDGESWALNYPATPWGGPDQFGAFELHIVVHASNACGYFGANWDRWYHGTTVITPTPTPEVTPELTPEVTPTPTEPVTGEPVLPGAQCLWHGTQLPLGVFEGLIDGHTLEVWEHEGERLGQVGPFTHGTWMSEGETRSYLIEGIEFFANWTIVLGVPQYNCWEIAPQQPTPTPQADCDPITGCVGDSLEETLGTNGAIFWQGQFDGDFRGLFMTRNGSQLFGPTSELILESGDLKVFRFEGRIRGLSAGNQPFASLEGVDEFWSCAVEVQPEQVREDKFFVLPGQVPGEVAKALGLELDDQRITSAFAALRHGRLTWHSR